MTAWGIGYEMTHSFGEARISDYQVVSHGKLQDSITISVADTETSTQVNIIKTTAVSTNMSIPVPKRDQHLRDWDLGGNTLE